MNKKRKLIFSGITAFFILTAFYFFKGKGANEEGDLVATVKKGKFIIDVNTTGELKAKNSVKIQGPNGIMAAGIYNLKIENMVDEGKQVKKGDFVAQLDKADLSGKISNAHDEFEKAQSQYTQTKLDTTLTLREARDEITNLKYSTEEKQLVMELSVFEPEATKKQARIDYEKSERAYKQALENYKIKKERSVAKMQEANASYSKAERFLQLLKGLEEGFTVRAPEDGMVVYAREWNGERRGVGSNIGPWDPTVATLPDLSVMLSTTYVNEIDIRKIKNGQEVLVGLDAFPDKKLTGKVVSVANMGEQKPNSDAKVFQVNILINESDTTLRPAMTTSNTIIAEVINDVLFTPLESIHTQGDSLTFVYKKQGISFVKQQVELGASNSNEIIIKKGLEEGDKVYLSVPSGGEGKEVVLINNK